MASKLLILLSSMLLLAVSSEGYYWKRFNGTIPEDAIVGCKNFGYNLYIGRGPISDTSMYFGPITPGSDVITATTQTSIYPLSEHLEVLCADNDDNLVWASANSSSVSSIAGQITGGHDYTLTKLYLGRVSLKGGTCAVGNAVEASDFKFYYLDGGIRVTSSFEVLISY